MSSIDKYVIPLARGIDSRVIIETINGRIKGFINGEKIFDIADRHDWNLTDSERSTIIRAVREYRHHQSAIERQKRREEEERKKEQARQQKLEQERQNAIKNVKAKIKSKQDLIAQILSSFDSIEKNKQKQISEIDKKINEVKKKFPNGNVSELTKLKEQIIKEFESNFERKKLEIEEINNILNSSNKLLSGHKSIEEVSKIDKDVSKIKVPTSIETVTINTNSINKEIEKINKSITELNNVINLSNCIEDEFIKEQIVHDISNINLCDKTQIKNVIDSVLDKVENYRSKLYEKNLMKQIKEMTKLEEQLIGIRNLNEYHATDTYKLTEKENELLQKANEVLAEFIEVASSEYKVIEQDYTSIMNDIYSVINNPKDTIDNVTKINELSNLVKVAKDKTNKYQTHYEKYKTFKKEIEEHGGSFDDDFDYKNYIGQLTDLEGKIIDQLHKNEKEVINYRSFGIISSMYETGYELFKQENDEYSTELLFVNKKYPGVLTRFFVNSDGSFRRSLVCVKIDDEVTNVDEVVKMSEEMESEVIAFLKDFNETEDVDINFDRENMVSYDSSNAREAIIENGYIELVGKPKEVFLKYMEENKKEQNVQTFVNIFEKYKPSVHRASDSRREKENSRNNSSSIKRAMAREFK